MNTQAMSSLLLLCSGPLLPHGPAAVVLDGPSTVPSVFTFGTPRCAAQNGAFTCFLTDDGGSTTMLWRTDGTSAGTTLVHAIDAYTPADLEMVARNGLVFFTAPSRSAGIELWVSDGTALGTLLLDLNAGASSSSPKKLTVDLHTTGTAVYFSAFDGVAGRELWASNGTVAGTRRVANLYPGIGSSMLATDEICPTSTTVWFAANNGSTGRELWRYNRSGTPVLQADIAPGSGSSNPRHFVSAMSDLLFSATGPYYGNELYRLNGSTLTLVDVKPGTASSTPDHLVLYYPQTGIRYCFFKAMGHSYRTIYRYNLISGAVTEIDVPGFDPIPSMVIGSKLLFLDDWQGNYLLCSIPVGGSVGAVLRTTGSPFEAPFAAFSSPNAALVRTVDGELYRTDGTSAGTVQDATLLDPVLVRLPGGTRVLSRGLLVVDNNPATPHVDLYP